MCGIFGIWNRAGGQPSLDSLYAGTRSLRHRGPDDAGYLLAASRTGETLHAGDSDTDPRLSLPRLESLADGAGFDLTLGFRRLSILDLSPAGHQPMASADGRQWIVFNGEIYNHVELRRELQSDYRFRSDSDTEVILAAYQRWGRDCVTRFNGMWAFALWDTHRRELFMSRDRFGVKPFFYSTSADATFVFASEAKAIIASGAVPFVPARLAFSSFVALGRSPEVAAGETFFEGIASLPPACNAVLGSEGLRVWQYWHVPDAEGAAPREQEAVEEYRTLFEDAVRVHLRSDVAVGTCLSGGLDSSSIVAVTSALMRQEHGVALEQLGSRQRTFSAVYDIPGRWDERPHIERVLASTGADGAFVTPSGERLWSDLAKLVFYQEEPFPTTSIFAQWCVMALAREHGVTVLLDGQGADELLAGYQGAYAVQVVNLAASGRVFEAFRTRSQINRVNRISGPAVASALLRRMPQFLLRHAFAAGYQPSVYRSGLSADARAEMLRALRGRDRSALHPGYRSVDDLCRFWLAEGLPHLLRYEDRNAMAFSIEGRVPFLDHRLAEYVFRLGTTMRIRDGWTKWLHRRAVEPVLPPEIVWRRDKVGFETPQAEWVRSGVDVGHWSDRAHTHRDLLDVAEVATQLHAFRAGQSHADRAWRWICALTWLDEYGALARNAAGQRGLAAAAAGIRRAASGAAPDAEPEVGPNTGTT